MISASTRRRLYGSMAFVATTMTFSQAAQAQDECGVIPSGGSVTCTAAGNPYADGIFYVAFGDATINLDPGVSVVDNSGTDNPGLFAIIGDDGNLTINGATNTSIATTGNNAVGVQAFTNAGQLIVSLDQVSTEGTGGGIQAGASDGDVSVSANSVTTLGTGADAVEVTTNNGDVTVDVGTVATSGDGANGVRARSDFGDVSVTADSITTTGNQSGFLDPGANGVLAQTGGAGTLTVDVGSIDTSGTGAIGIRATNNTAALMVNADSITTTGDAAEGISVRSAGAVDVNAGTISTAGLGANGIQAQSTGSVSIDFDSVTTTGDNSVGVLVPQGALFFGPVFTPNVTITGGDVSTSGLNSDGVRAIASTGTSSVTLDGMVTTTGDGSRGIVAAGDTGVSVTGPFTVSTSGLNATGVELTSVGSVDFDNIGGSITTTGDASDGLLVNGIVGPVTIDAGMINVAGTGSTAINSTTTSGSQMIMANDTINSDLGDGIVATSTDGDISITNGAALTAAGNGIAATSTGTGSITVVRTGASDLTSTGAAGISTNAVDGMTTVTTGTGTISGSPTAIQMVSATGDQMLTANGDITGDVNGIHSDTAGNRVIDIAAGADITGTTQAVLLTNTGTATLNNGGTIGAASTDLALNATAAGATTVNNMAGGTLNGMLMFGGDDDTLTNAGTFNTQGTTDFGAGADTFTNTGTLNLMGDTVFANLETLNLGGTTNLDTYTLTGSGALNNTGTLNSNGGTLTGFTSFRNSGNLYLAGTTTVDPLPFDNTGTVYSVDGDATLTGQTVFNNMGTISMVDDAADDTLTIDSDYVGGTGARLAVDADYDVADMLIVNGDISGSTAVDANVLGTGALVSGGVQVVDGMGASTANAFTLGNVTGGSALVNYAVEQDGSDYYLTGALNQAGFTPLRLASMVNDFWYPSADEIIANLAVPYKGGDGIGFWADGYLSREKFGDNNVGYSFGGVNYTVDQRVKLGHMGLQAGVDYGMGGTGRIGLTAGYSRHKGRDGNDIEAKGWNLGIYGAFGGVTGFHGEALAKYDRYKVDFNDGFFDPFNPKVKSFGFDGSLGYRIPMGGENSSFDLAAGLSHVSSKIDDTVAYGLTYDYDRVKSTRGRASARYNFGGDLQPYVQATAYHEFANAGRVGLFDGVNTYDLENAKRGTWGRIEGGIGGSPNRFPTLAAWADFGDVKGIGARLGMRFGAEAEAAPPPPPPPPPPAEPAPPPATQTCYDGSVILATDTCPVPPPPPPPPPAPERG